MAAKTQISTLMCPTNGMLLADPQGYGQTDYVATVHTDIDPVTGVLNGATWMDGALNLGGTRLARITDGTSYTIALVEDSPMNYETQFPFVTSMSPDPVIAAGNDADTPTPSGNRAMNRWAEPDNAAGISGPQNATPGNLKGVVNNNSNPPGGPPDCLWKLSNCGPNGEIFSQHPLGATCCFATAACSSCKSASIRAWVRKLVTRAESITVSETDYLE